MKTADLDYDLPPELVATRPVHPRHDARLLVIRRETGALEHHTVRDLADLLEPTDLLVRNDTAVLAARLVGHKTVQGRRGGGRVEGLFLEAHADGTWTVLLQARGRLEAGQCVHLRGGCTLELIAPEGRQWRVRPSTTMSSHDVSDVLDRAGCTPLPPYILKARRDRQESIEDVQDRDWYATTFARDDRRGSVAAPTAGLHFTPNLLADLNARGVASCCVTLHVGAGTFRPVQVADLADHDMHAERWSLDDLAARALSAHAGRIVAVGTTSARLVESLPDPLPVAACSGSTELMIQPGHDWRHVGALMTNFHLPRSTLLALVAGMIGVELMRTAYAVAVEHRYRFYSYGDAMLILE